MLSHEDPVKLILAANATWRCCIALTPHMDVSKLLKRRVDGPNVPAAQYIVAGKWQRSGRVSEVFNILFCSVKQVIPRSKEGYAASLTAMSDLTGHRVPD